MSNDDDQVRIRVDIRQTPGEPPEFNIQADFAAGDGQMTAAICHHLNLIRQALSDPIASSEELLGFIGRGHRPDKVPEAPSRPQLRPVPMPGADDQRRVESERLIEEVLKRRKDEPKRAD